MAKRRIQCDELQTTAEQPSTVTVQLPLPLMSTLREIQEGFLALCVSTGREALIAMMEQDRTALCGPKWLPNPQRKAGRGGSTGSEITLGGRRIEIRRLRANAINGPELELPSFAWAASRDPLNSHTMDAILAGISTRKYAASLDRLPAEESERAVSKSSVSRRFVAMSTELLERWRQRRLDALDLRVVMIDGIHFRRKCLLIALGISVGGEKHVLGIEEGSTENGVVVQGLVNNLIDRGLRADRTLLFVIDGSKALSMAIRNTFGSKTLIQRCQVHKRRNVCGYLPKSMQPSVTKAMNQAYNSSEVRTARKQLVRLANALQSDHPGAAASLREGLEETLTVQTLGIRGDLFKTLRSTNTIESLNGSVVLATRNVRNWQGGTMLLRWVATALHEAEQHFNRVKGFKDMERLDRLLRKRDKQTIVSEVDNKKKAA